MTSGGHLATVRSAFMGTVRMEALAVRHYQCSSPGDPESCCLSGPNPLLHLHILFPGCILSEPTWVHCPHVYSQTQGVARGSSLQRALKMLSKCLCMPLMVGQVGRLGSGPRLIVPWDTDSKAESEDLHPRILDPNVAAQVVTKVD